MVKENEKIRIFRDGKVAVVVYPKDDNLLFRKLMDSATRTNAVDFYRPDVVLFRFRDVKTAERFAKKIGERYVEE